jgi:hypothetical protein
LIFIGTPGARVEKEIKNHGWLGCAQENAWFDGRVGQIWIEQVLKPYVRDTDQAFLLIDHFKVHFAAAFVQSANDLGVDVDYIPAGYTCVLQPVDVGVNATFKREIRDFHHKWCMEHYPKILDDDKVPTPERDDVYDWVIQSFEKVSEVSIRKTYRYIGLVDQKAYDNMLDDDEETVEAETVDEGVFDDEEQVEQDDDYPEEKDPIDDAINKLRNEMQNMDVD